MSSALWWRRVFVGEKGLRAGWSLLLYASLFGVLFVVEGKALHLVHVSEPWGPIVGEASALVAAILATRGMARLEGRSWHEFGLPVSMGLSSSPWVGAGWGLAAITTLVALLQVLGVLRFDGIELHSWSIVGFAAMWGLMFLLVGLFEELLLRGYAQFTLARGVGFWPAAILLSALFGAAHLNNEGESWIGALSVALLGLVMCLTLRRTGNLWFAVGFHAAFDWGESFVFSLPDSGQMVPGHLLDATLHGPSLLTGGSVGPEGSLACLIVIGALWLVFARWTRHSTPRHQGTAP